METTLWKLGNPLLAISPWRSETWFLALAPLGHGLQTLAMIALLIASTQVNQPGTNERQSDAPASYVRWSAITVVRLAIHTILESWLVYRHSRRFAPRPWLLADVEANAGEGIAMNDLQEMQEVRVPTPHPDPSPSHPPPPASASGSETRIPGPSRSASGSGRDAVDPETPDEKTEAASSNPTGDLADAAVVPVLNRSASSASSYATPAPSPTASSSATGASSMSRRAARQARRAARERSKQPDFAPGATNDAILEEPPAPVAALTARSMAEAAKRRAERLKWWDHTAASVDLWVCSWGFVMWVTGLVIAFPIEPVRSEQPLIFASVMVGMLSNWFSAFGFAACFVLWTMGYLVVLGMWILWHLGLIRGVQPVLFPRSTARKLPPEELEKCPLVIYAADPEEDEPEWDEPPGRPLPVSEIDTSKLPHPLRVLGQNKATCGICHCEFVPPCIVEDQEEYELEILRELPCLHTFHRECVDEWLLNHADTCPYCTQSVPDMLKDPERAKVAASEGGSAAGSTAAEPEGLLELRRTMSRRRSQRTLRSRASGRSGSRASGRSASIRSASMDSVRSTTPLGPETSTEAAGQTASMRSTPLAASVTSGKATPREQHSKEGSVSTGFVTGQSSETASISTQESEAFYDSREQSTPTPVAGMPGHFAVSTPTPTEELRDGR